MILYKNATRGFLEVYLFFLCSAARLPCFELRRIVLENLEPQAWICSSVPEISEPSDQFDGSAGRIIVTSVPDDLRA